MNDDNNGNVEMWLWLLLVMQPRNSKTHAILRTSGYNLRRACVQMRDGAFPFLSESDNERIQTIRLGKVRELQRLCADNGISIVTYDSESYPELLRFIDNPPIVLFVQGDILCLKGKQIVSAVGTRKPSEYSIKTTHRICGSLAKGGAAIVSGLAVGLDTAAHEAALENDGITVGVLACGNLVNYPADSKNLKKEILENGGALISELLPHSPLPKGYFPMRNRIISGISDEVLVLEAAEGSGSLLTAEHAFEQRRRVFFIPPHDISDDRYSAAASLFKNGASPVFSADDILGSFALSRSLANPSFNAADYNSAPSPTPKDIKPKKKQEHKKASAPLPTSAAISEPTSAASEKAVKIPNALDETETAIYKALLRGPADVDTIVARTEIYYREIMVALLSLEIGGHIVRNADATYSVT